VLLLNKTPDLRRCLRKREKCERVDRNFKLVGKNQNHVPGHEINKVKGYIVYIIIQ